MPSIEALRDVALAYAARGFYVFPCLAGSKAPATPNGFKDASRDETQILSWWDVMPYNVAIRTGPESGFFVVDVDPHNGGIYIDAEQRPAQVTTPHDGWHYRYRWPQGVLKMKSQLAAGVDIKGAGGYVIGAGEVDGKPYVESSVELYDAPASLLASIAILEGVVADRPGDRFNEDADFHEILTSAGWTFAYEHDGLDYWIRPGKDEGPGATTGIRDKGAGNGEPKELLYVFTTSTDFEAGRGYDKYAVWCVLNGYDPSTPDAARALSDEMGTVPRITPSLVRGDSAAPGVAGVPSALAAPAYSFEPACRPDHLVSRYIAYGSMLTDAALEYHEAAVLAILSSVTPNIRIDIAASPAGLSTNLYLMLAGMSSVSRKSTVQDIATPFIQMLAGLDSLLPDDMTDVAAIDALAARSGRGAVWLPDELGLTLKQVYTREYKGGIEALLLQLYGGKAYSYRTMGGGTTTVENVHLTILGAATPDSFAGIGSRAASSGLLPRFGIAYPEVPPPPQPNQRGTAEQRAAGEAIRNDLIRIKGFVLTGDTVTLSDEALEVIGAADGTFSGNPMTARLATTAYKVAALLALCDMSWNVDIEHAEAAVRICRRWAGGATRLRRFLGKSAASVAFAEMLDGAREALAAAADLGTIAGRRKIHQDVAAKALVSELGIDANTVERIRRTMEMMGDVSMTTNGKSGIERELYWNYRHAG